MAAPNLTNASAVYLKSATVDLTTTSETAVLSNAATSGNLLKVDSVIVANIDGTTAYPITLTYHNAAALAGTSTIIASTVSVPANSSLVIIDRTTAVYLEENTSLGATAGTGSKLKVYCAYEQVS